MASNGLSIEDWLVLHCEAVRGLEESESFDCFDDLNEIMLRYLCVMDDYSADTLESESETRSELNKLHLKSDLALNLMGEMLWGSLRLTPPKWVRLSGREIRWRDSISLQAGQLVRLQIYPRRNFPIKLSFFARILSAEEREEGSNLLIAEFCEPTESLVYWLEKFIFQQHRRTIAKQSDSDET